MSAKDSGMAPTITDTTLQRIEDLIGGDLENEYAGHLMLGGGTRGGPILHHGKGVRVWDIKGKSYIDCTSQSWALYLGYANEELWEAINQQAHCLTHVHQGFDTLGRFYLAKKMADILPGTLNRVSFVPSSGLAIEGSMKLALKNRPGSDSFVSLWDGYHGTTLGTMGASWISTKSAGQYIGGSRFLPLTKPTVKVPNPYCYRCCFGQKPENCDLMCATMLEQTLKKGVNGPAAGVILEPLQASAGMIPCPKRYLKKVRQICDDTGTPLIFDEIQTYMRIGAFTGAEHYGVVPDLAAFGKAIGGGLPLGITAVRDGMEPFKADTEELHTFACNTLSIIGAIKQIEMVERDHILDNTNAMGARLKAGLVKLQQQFPEIGDIRQVGLHIGVEMIRDPQSKTPIPDQVKAIRNEGMTRGAIFGIAGVMKHLLKIKPPLIITAEEVDEVLDIFEQSLKAVLRT